MASNLLLKLIVILASASTVASLDEYWRKCCTVGCTSGCHYNGDAINCKAGENDCGVYITRMSGGAVVCCADTLDDISSTCSYQCTEEVGCPAFQDLSVSGDCVTSESCLDECRCPTGHSGCGGEPHFKRWNGQYYDYHGECDLVLIRAASFGSGEGLDVHIRTTARYDYSFISSAALRIGNDVLEVASFGSYLLNGVTDAKMPASISGYPVTHTQIDDRQSAFDVQVGDGHIHLKTFKDLVSVSFDNVTKEDFLDSVGLMGEFGSGRLLSRNGTLLEDYNELGQNWQVLETEPKLFANPDRTPQHPHQQCVLPDAKAQQRRRLGTRLPTDAVDEACSIWEDAQAKEACVYDVMMTGDLEMAEAGGY